MLKMKRIDSIEIENIKGIKHRKFNLNIIPNKPTLLVAPNGFGKTSFSIGFLSLNANRINLHDDYFHETISSHAPKISVTYTLENNTHETKEANSNKNDLSSVFDVYVVNSQLIAKAKKLKISGNVITSGSLEIAPIVLIEKIPERKKLDYKLSKIRSDFGANGKILPNISSELDNQTFLKKIDQNVDFSKVGQVKLGRIIDSFRVDINRLVGTSVEVLVSGEAVLSQLDEVAYLVEIAAIFECNAHMSKLERFLAAIQVADVYSKDKTIFRKALAYAKYDSEKKICVEAMSSFKSTWKGIAPKEDTKNGLVIDFPKANQISNGERDVICFVASLLKARLKLKKSYCLLVIDEIFDYLDDANLISCQFYLTQMIAEFKKDGKQIFPLIMTHLNPSYFKNFCFKDQKVHYLNRKSTRVSSLVEPLIKMREDQSIKKELSRHFLHFDPTDIDLSSQFSVLGLPTQWAKSSSFYHHIDSELTRYLSDQNFDPLAVCCAVRVSIEKSVFASLAPQFQIAFLDTHKTSEKLSFADSNGAEVKEVYYLLAIIYNEALHVRANQDNVTPLLSKLENLTIRHMIKQALG